MFGIWDGEEPEYSVEERNVRYATKMERLMLNQADLRQKRLRAELSATKDEAEINWIKYGNNH